MYPAYNTASIHFWHFEKCVATIKDKWASRPKPHFRLILTMCVWTSETNEHACQLLLHSSLCLTFLLSAFQAESNLCAIGFGSLQFRVKQVWQLVWGLRFPASSIAETDFIFKIWFREKLLFSRCRESGGHFGRPQKPHSMEDNIRQWPKYSHCVYPCVLLACSIHAGLKILSNFRNDP